MRSRPGLVAVALSLLATNAGAVMPVASGVSSGEEATSAAASRRVRQRPGRGAPRFDRLAPPGEIDAASRAIVDGDRPFFGVAAASLGRAEIRSFADGRTHVDYTQFHRGVEVAGGGVSLRFFEGRPVLAKSTAYGGVAVDVVPAVERAAAEGAMLRLHAGRGASLEGPAELVIFPEALAAGGGNAAPDGEDTIRFRLGWRATVAVRRPVARYATVIAADGSGDLLERRDLVAHAAAQLRVEVEPRFAGQPRIAAPARGHTIDEGTSTDADGIFEAAPGERTVRSAGPFFSVNDAGGGEASESFTVAGTGGEQFLWSVADEALAEIDAFYHAHTVRERQLRVTPDLAFLASPFPINVNLGGSCNAYYDGGSINFLSAGGGCNNTARLADVVYHEYGHALHDRLSGSGPFDAQIQEGVADYFAHTITGDPALGPQFFAGNANGIRNATEVRNYPEGVQGPYAEVHQSGRIWAHAWWNLRNAFITKHGSNAGVRIADRLHSTTLRGNPGYTDAYLEALAADDEDGDLANGTPNSCEITAEFQARGLVSTPQPGRGFLSLSHDPPRAENGVGEGRPVPVSVVVESRSPSCGALDPSSVELVTRIGGVEQVVALAGEGGAYAGEIPGQPAGTVVEYWIRARESAFGASFTRPLGAPANLFRYYVGPLETVFRDGFEEEAGWTHGGTAARDDDWERGAPRGFGLDPEAAFDGSAAIGNDLGLRDGNGLYEPGGARWLQSPVIDCSDCRGARLQFRRWLSVDGSASDQARVLVNGQVVWTNEAEPRADLEWTFVDLDIAAIADGQPSVAVRFELSSDAAVEAGGWTLDEVAVRALDGGTNEGFGAGAIDGGRLDGGCHCSTVAVDPSAAVSPAGGAAAMVGFALLRVLARRRRAA